MYHLELVRVILEYDDQHLYSEIWSIVEAYCSMVKATIINVLVSFHRSSLIH